ncbi:MAG: YIP1 family protein [Candidatus Nanoarchaeia archaeon]|nr:YIP1 family protein [Candidatus Omnitrophota bacterium]MDD5417539.1 YIP1 family protein [Candidatus Nanoarchaeia archaeon]
MNTRLLEFIFNPEKTFEKTKKEGWKQPFIFFTASLLFIALVTPLFNVMGVRNTDLTSSLQSQILAYKIAEAILPTYGSVVFMFMPTWIVFFSFIILPITALIIHIIYKKILKGTGTFTDALRCACYGIAPCVIGGYIPIISVFLAVYSVFMQFYIFPKIAYKTENINSLIVLVGVMSIIIMELFIFGSTIIV